MFNSRSVFLAAVMIVAFVIGCSGSGGEILNIPPKDAKADIDLSTGTMACLGLWNVSIDKATGQIDVADLRSSENIINVLGFLEPPALTGMTIEFGSLSIVDPEIQVNVILTHPIPDPVFMGFDVRGVVFGPKVTNADGLTIIPGPEFFKGVPFGYQDGLLGTPDSVAHYKGLAGYKYFCDGLGADDDLVTFMSNPDNLARRGVFTQNPTQNSRHYILNWTGTSHAFFTFNYAIYANYDWPVGDAPIDVDDFFITTANSQEAFCAKVSEVSNSLWYIGTSGGGGFSINAEIWDWQGNINSVTFWSPDLTLTAETTATSAGAGTTPYSYVFNCAKAAVSPKKLGMATIYIKAIDTKTFGQSWLMGLLPPSKTMYGKKIYNVFTYSIEVGEGCPPPTVTSIIPTKMDMGKQVNNAQIIGQFLDGTSLAAKLTKTGSLDIIGTDIKFVSSTKITADFDLTGAAIGKWDVVVTNGCGTDGTGIELFEVTCPVTKVDSISPGMGSPGDFLDNAEITGTIAAGTQLAVRLVKGGSSDIQGDDVQFIDGTKITADFDLTGAALGLWDVVVTNGCGAEGTGTGLFAVAQISWKENFDSDPANWFYGNFMWEDWCGVWDTPQWTANDPFGPSGSGNIRCPITGVSADGGSLSTVVSMPFYIPTGYSEAYLRVYQCFSPGPSAWVGWFSSNWKIVESSTPELYPFVNGYNADLPPGGAYLDNTEAFGSTGWGTYTYNCYAGPMAYQPGWDSKQSFGGGAFPGSLTEYLDLVIPPEFYGKTVKVCWQCQSDECYGYGASSGFAIDDMTLWGF